MSIKPFNVYFGGTFDPPHRGHFDMLNALARDELTARIFVTPTHLNPLKKLSTQVAAFGDSARRQQWVQLWIEESKRANPAVAPKIELNLAEITAGLVTSETPSYTIETVRALIAQHASSRWAMVLGSDSLEHLESWKQIDDLLELLDGVWIFRRGSQQEPLQKNT